MKRLTPVWPPVHELEGLGLVARHLTFEQPGFDCQFSLLPENILVAEASCRAFLNDDLVIVVKLISLGGKRYL